MCLKIIDASFHRNGICGVGFHAVIFTDSEYGDAKFIASLFDESGYCAVYQIDQLAAGNIAFARGNSWRGDNYQSELRPLLKEWQEKHGSNRLGPFAAVPPDVLDAMAKKVTR